MSQPVKTSTDWMSLFTGSRDGRDGALSPSLYTGYSGSRYSRDALQNPTTPRTSRTSFDRSSSYTSDRSSYSTHTALGRMDYYDRDRYSSRLASYPTPSYRSYSREEDTEDARDARDANENRQNENKQETVGVRGSMSCPVRNQAVVLNQGVTIITRNKVDDSSDDESEEEEEEEEVEEVEPEPERDPLEVEEEELMTKLQTAGFLLSLPEEERIKRRLLEIKQMKEHPEMFLPENSYYHRFAQVAEEAAKISAARKEEEKILLLRLGSSSIGDVEQTDIQVRLQEMWRDRKQELETGVGKVEQEYEHILQETSTEMAEIEGSIRGKNSLIAKLQEEILALKMRKERMAKDMEKVTEDHESKLEESSAEVTELEEKMSKYSNVVRPPKKEDCGLPEDERTEVESELECPVCMEICRPPIYQCGEGHIICSNCKPLLKQCSQCEGLYSDPPIRCRFAEKLAARYFRDEE